MPTPLKNNVTILLALVALAGCATAERPSLQVIEHRIPPLPANVYEPSQVSTQPIPVFQARPRYPSAYRNAGVGGEGVVLFTVGTDGSVRDAMVVRASDVLFGDAALESVTQWIFKPAQMNGTPVNCRMIVPIVFNVNE
jgi:TonB family protein